MAAGARELTARAPALRARRTRLRARPAAAALARIPRAAWLCALVAVLNAAAWSIVTPPFQVPDEQAHYAYTEYLVQHGRPPVSAPVDRFSASQQRALSDLKWESTRFVPANRVPWSAWEQRRLERDLARPLDRAGGNGGGNTFGGEPPLYYALQSIPYRLASGGTVLDRLQLMRLCSTLLGGLAVLFVFLFLRELLPGTPWAWTVGALGVAFQPLFGFITGGVNSDALLYAASAALFLALARAFRRGLTPGSAAAVGAALGIGLVTKFNAMGLVPGAALALAALAIRRDGPRLRALRLPALALAIAAAPLLLETTLNAAVWGRPAFGAAATSDFGLGGIHPTLLGALSYDWQFWLIPLPGQRAPIGGFPLWESWIQGFVGLFGWIDTEWRQPVYLAALVPLGAIAALALAALARQREALARRRVELLAYGTLAAIFMAFVATASYVVWVRLHGSIAQARYLLPLVSLYAALLALAVRGAGRRWAPYVGSAIVALAIAHDVFAQLLVVSRYYA
jgi:4-amino-4-deoxy-L-arabinose transferase-like glycosyltransferase